MTDNFDNFIDSDLMELKGVFYSGDSGLAPGATGYITEPAKGHEIKETVLNYIEGQKVSHD